MARLNMYTSTGIRTFPDRYVRSTIHVPPAKVIVVASSNNPDLEAAVKLLVRRLKAMGITKVDSSAVSIGWPWAKNDEVGAPFVITVDFDALRDSSVTLIERDSMEQVRASIHDIMKSRAIRAVASTRTTYRHITLTNIDVIS